MNKGWWYLLYMVAIIAIIFPVFIQGCAEKPHIADNASNVIALPEEKINESKHLEAINRGDEWYLLNETSEFIAYSYDIEKDEYDKSSNAVRLVASLWAIARMYKFTGDERYIILAEKGLNYFRQYFKYDLFNGF